MSSVNAQLQRAILRHQVGIIRLGAAEARKVIELLDRADLEIAEKISRLPEGQQGRRLLESRLREIRRLNVAAHNRLGRFLRGNLLEVGKYELDYQQKMLGEIVPLQVSWVRLSSEQLEAIVSNEAFAGRLLDEWVESLEVDKFNRVRDAIRVGMIEGQSIPGIVRRIYGTKKNRYKDGILAIPRRHVESVVRTAVNAIANTARDQMYLENSDVVKAVEWLSTLDTRTTDICLERDGKVWRVDEAHPRPPAHVRCRSTLSPVLKSWEELGIEAGSIAPEFRASMDGVVPQRLKAKQWLMGEPRETVEMMLGKKLTIQFYENPDAPLVRDLAASPLTVEELRRLGM